MKKKIPLSSCLAPCLLLFFVVGCAKIEWREVRHPSGGMKERYQVSIGSDGKEIKHGPYYSWYINGHKEFDGGFDLGKAHGYWEGWFESGGKKFEGNFDRNLPAKKWVLWDESGREVFQGQGFGDKIYPYKVWWEKNKHIAINAIPDVAKAVESRK